MIETLRLFGCVCKNALTFVRKWKVDRCRNFLPNRGTTLNFLANAFDRGMISQETIGQVLILADQTQQQVLSLNGGAAKLAGFVASKEYDPPGSFSVSFEHSLMILSCSRKSCRLCLRTHVPQAPFESIST